MLSKFDKIFRPWKKWENVKLTDECPCLKCDITKQRIDNCYYYMMSSGAEEELTEKCEHCIDKTIWTVDCLQKLQWYEDHDERLKST